MILVTGASGFLGCEVLQAFDRIKPAKPIVALSRRRIQGYSASGRRRVSFLETDITDAAGVSRVPSAVTTLIHLAAFVPHTAKDFSSPENYRVNCGGIMTLMGHLTQKTALKHVIYASSISVYGSRRGLIREDDACSPEDDYGRTKWLGELLLTDLCRRHSIRLTILRLSSVYGPGQDRRSVLPLFQDRCRRGEDLKLFAKGRRYQDFIYLKDAAHAFVAAYQTKSPGIFNIGTGEKITMKRLAEIMLKIHPGTASRIVDAYESDPKPSMLFSIAKARRMLQFHPEYHLIEGLLDYAKTEACRER